MRRPSVLVHISFGEKATQDTVLSEEHVAKSLDARMSAREMHAMRRLTDQSLEALYHHFHRYVRRQRDGCLSDQREFGDVSACWNKTHLINPFMKLNCVRILVVNASSRRT